MITSKQRSFLRSLANEIEPVFQVGKGGISENLIKQVNDVLEVRELIKLTVLNNSMESPREVLDQIAEETGAEAVQAIGKKIVLYKESKEHKKIVLPSSKKQ